MRDITVIRLIRARKAHVCDVCKKQIICGDFYWLATLPSSKESKGKVCQSCIEKLNKLEVNQEIEKIKGRGAFIRNIMKKLNYIGAITIWDALDKDEAMNLLWNVIEKDLIYKEQINGKDIKKLSFK